jgi:hypothetical protein
MPVSHKPVRLSEIQTVWGGSNPAALSEYYAGGGNVPSGEEGWISTLSSGAIPSSGEHRMKYFINTASTEFFGNTQQVTAPTDAKFANYVFYHTREDLYGSPPNTIPLIHQTLEYRNNNGANQNVPSLKYNDYFKVSNSSSGIFRDNITQAWGHVNHDDDVVRALEIRLYLVPHNCNYVLIEGWGAGGGASWGWYNMSSNGGGGGYCRTYLYVGTHINPGDCIAVCPGTPGSAGAWIASGNGGGATVAWIAGDVDDYKYHTSWETQSPIEHIHLQKTSNSTVDARKRTLLRSINSNNIIFCAGGGGGGGGYNWSYQSLPHGGAGGQNGSNGSLGVSTAQVGTSSSHATGSMTASQNSRSGSYTGSESHFTSSSSATPNRITDGYDWQRIVFPQNPLTSKYSTESTSYATPASAGGGVWSSNGGNTGYAGNASYAGSRGAAGGVVAVYKGQSTSAQNGSSTSPGTTSGSLGGLVSTSNSTNNKTNTAYGGNGNQYTYNNHRYGNDGGVGQFNIRFYN